MKPIDRPKINALSSIAILLAGICLTAEGAGNAAGPTTLPGSDTTLEAATSRADVVVIGKVQKLSRPSTDELGGANRTMEIIASRILKGKKQPEPMTFSVFIISRPHADKPEEESSPKLGQSYIFFLKSGPPQIFIFIKMAENTDANVPATLKLAAQDASTRPTTTPHTTTLQDP